MALSAPLQTLMDEHVMLRADMNAFYENTENITSASGPIVVQQFKILHERISSFTANLRVHSRREEQGLFPMLASHLEQDDKRIEVLEIEHQKAERHLQDFLSVAEHLHTDVDELKAQSITIYALQAYTTLIEHFAKEEAALFPLADKILSSDEKEELERWLKTY